MGANGWSGILAMLTSGLLGSQASPAIPRSLADLPAGLEALATFEGEPVEVVARGGPPALIVERAHGVKGPEGWQVFWSHRLPTARLRLILPAGALDVAPGDLRLYLAPLASRVYLPGQRAEAPPPIQEALDSERRDITFELHALRARTRYHVRAARETYHLPPAGPGADPEPQTHAVLWVSDLPFVDGKPQRPLTPAGQQHRY